MSKTNTFLNMVEAAADWVAERFGNAANTANDTITSVDDECLDDESVDVWGNKCESWSHVMDESPAGPYPHLDPHRDIYMAWDDD